MLKQTILVVDDMESQHVLISQILENNYNLIFANSGFDAIKKFEAHQEDIDLILLDHRMPELSGIETMEILQKEKQLTTPVIFVTSTDNQEFEAECFRARAVDYIKKPYNPYAIKSRIAGHISNKKTIKSFFIFSTNILVYRSGESGEHTERVRKITRMLINKLRESTDMLEKWTPEALEHVVYASSLHDIGKIGIDDDILHKKEKFTADEFEKMKQHTTIGRDIVKDLFIGEYIGEIKDFGKIAMEVTEFHHEKWDGTGYLQSLKGKEIPISARIVAVTDSFDTIVSPRSYKEAQLIERAFEILKEESGKCFDPEMVKAMFGIKDNIIRLYEKEEVVEYQEDIILLQKKLPPKNQS